MPPQSKSLGPLLAYARHRPLSWFDFFTWILLGIVAVLLPLLYGYYRQRYAYTNFGPVAATLWSRPWYILAIIALLAFIILAVYRLLLTRRFVAVHKHGIRLALSGKRVLHWKEVSGIASSTTQYQFLNKPLRTSYHARLYPNIGKSIQLDNSLQGLPEVLRHIKAQLYPHITPALQSDFKQGKWLHFGQISIQQRALQVHNKQYSWSEIENIAANRGKLIIETTLNTRHTVALGKIPNIEILLQLIHQEVKA